VHIRKPLAAAVALNTVVFGSEAVAGLRAGSLSLLMDAVHNLSDELALVCLLLAYSLSLYLSRVSSELRTSSTRSASSESVPYSFGRRSSEFFTLSPTRIDLVRRGDFRRTWQLGCGSHPCSLAESKPGDPSRLPAQRGRRLRLPRPCSRRPPCVPLRASGLRSTGRAGRRCLDHGDDRIGTLAFQRSPSLARGCQMPA